MKLPSLKKPRLAAVGVPMLLMSQCAPQQCAPAPGPAPATFVVTHVVDGDTVDLNSGARVRVIGIDAPEVGQCGYAEASARMAALVLDRAVSAPGGARDDVDRYGRILRYIDVNGVDAGDTLIRDGLAVARYDSRDGYGAHPREPGYIADDAASPVGYSCAPSSPGTPVDTTYANCTAVWNAIGRSLMSTEPGYTAGLDADHDGIACETDPR